MLVIISKGAIIPSSFCRTLLLLLLLGITSVVVGCGDQSAVGVPSQYSIITAFVIKAAVHSALQGLFPPSSRLDSADTTGSELITKISDTESLSGVTSAFSAYHDAVVQFTSESVSRPEGSEILTIDSTINAADGLRSNLFRVIKLPLSTKDFVQTYAAFFQGIQSDVKAGLSSLPGVESDDIASILMLTNMIGGLNTP